MTDDLTPDKEKSILAAARKRFAYYGFTKVTMDEIASDVAMGKASLYYYFPTKEKLFQSVLTQEKDHFLEVIHVIIKKDISACLKLKEYADKRFELFRELVNLSALSFSKTEMKTAFGDLFQELEKEEMNAVQQILQAGKRSGEFAVSNPQQTAGVIQHALHGLRIRVIHTIHGARMEEAVYADLKQEGKLLIELLLRGIQK